MSGITFAELDRTFAAQGAPVEAAEAHGALCGALCAVAGLRAADWIEEVLPTVRASDARELLEAVYDETAQALGGQAMAFAPLLPDDDLPLERRVAALAEWCAGFLYGLGAGQLPSLDEVPGEVGEVLRDFTEISRAEVGAESEEANESSYAELVEYVRAGTQVVYEELAAHRERNLPQGGGTH